MGGTSTKRSPRELVQPLAVGGVGVGENLGTLLGPEESGHAHPIEFEASLREGFLLWWGVLVSGFPFRAGRT